MTDPHHPDPDERDELASAHLDGATSAEEAARIAADPALQARVEELRAVRDAVAARPPIDAPRRDVAITAALAAFAEERAAPSAAAVTSLAVAARRRRSPTRALRLLGAAAAVVLLAALVPLLGKLGGSDDDAAETADRSETLSEAGAPLAAAGDGAETAPAAGSVGSTTTASSQTFELGRFDELSGLVAALEHRLTAEDSQVTATLDEGGDGVGCSAERNRYSSAESTERARVATATVADDPVIVLVVTDADGDRSIQVLHADTCDVLLERAL